MDDKQHKEPENSSVCLSLRFDQSKLSRNLKYGLLYCKLSGMFIPDLCSCKRSNIGVNAQERAGRRPCKASINHAKAQTFLSKKGSSQFFAKKMGQQNKNAFSETKANSNKTKQSDILPRGLDFFTVSDPLQQRNDGVPGVERNLQEMKKKCPHGNTRKLNCLKWIHFILVFILHLLNTVRNVRNTIETYQGGSDFVFSLTDGTIQGFFSLLFFADSFSHFRYLIPMICGWLDYEEKYEIHTDTAKVMKYGRIFFVAIMICLMVQITGYFVGMILFSDTMYTQVWPFETSHPSGLPLAAAVLGISSLMGNAAYFGANSIRGGLLLALYYEYKHVYEKLLGILTENTANNVLVEENFDDFINQQKSLNDLVERSYHVMKHTIGLAFTFSVPMFCFVIYGIINGSLKWDQILLLAYTVVMCVTGLVSITLTCGHINSQIRSVYNAPYAVSWKWLSPSMLQKLSVFMNQASAQDIDISVYGMFTVTTQTLLMLLGTILTYGIIVVQFQLGDTNTSCIPFNSTG